MGAFFFVEVFISCFPFSPKSCPKNANFASPNYVTNGANSSFDLSIAKKPKFFGAALAPFHEDDRTAPLAGALVDAALFAAHRAS